MQNLPRLIRTDRLIFRPFAPDDYLDVFEYASDPEVTRYMDWPTHASEEVSAAWIEETLAEWDQRQSFTWGVTTEHSSGRIVGAIGCTELSFKVSFGYVLSRAHWGKGIATEAATAVVATLGKVDGVRRIWATCDCENPASARVLSKSGCTLEGTLRNWSIRPNLPGAPVRDSYVYAKSVDA
jgi:[ribosomal protein S5]-alanine N-acetyltransferase